MAVWKLPEGYDAGLKLIIGGIMKTLIYLMGLVAAVSMTFSFNALACGEKKSDSDQAKTQSETQKSNQADTILRKIANVEKNRKSEKK